MSAARIIVTALAATPVKGLRVTPRGEVTLEHRGMLDNRRFYLVDERGRMLNGKQLAALSAVVADYDDAGRRLTLTFPDEIVVGGRVRLGPSLDTRFFSRPVRARLVQGPWAQALSEHVGRSLRLVEGDGTGVDRGRAGAVSLISSASLGELARRAGEDVDARRFRMLVEIEGVAAHEEDRWVGLRVRIGDAVVAIHGHVGRCLVTSRHPESGRVDLPTLDVLRSYRPELATTEPLAFGVYGEVVQAGVVRVGDVVAVECRSSRIARASSSPGGR